MQNQAAVQTVVIPADSISLEAARWRILNLWLVMTGLIFVFLVLRSMFANDVKGHISDVFGWFSPTFVPTLLLMVGALRGKTDDHRETRYIKRHLYALAFRLSLFYLVIASLTFFLEPFTGYTLLENMKQSNIWLGVIQGISTGAIGYMFNQQESVKAVPQRTSSTTRKRGVESAKPSESTIQEHQASSADGSRSVASIEGEQADEESSDDTTEKTA